MLVLTPLWQESFFQLKRKYMQEIITYRETRKEDYPAIIGLIIDSFQLRTYLDDYEMLAMWGRAYLHDCLHEATFSYSAIRDGECVGIIMGRSECQAKRGNVLEHKEIAEKYMEDFESASAIRTNGSFTAFEKVHHAYSILEIDNSGTKQGILTLFAVKKELRGQGIGTVLLNKLEEYLKENFTVSIYCFTDSTCNIGFYLSHGFEKAEEVRLTLKRNRKPENVSIYLIEKTLF